MKVFSLFLLLFVNMIATQTFAATFTVTTTADTGAGSLRQAILAANGSPAPDTINFNISSVGPHIITPVTNLPTITAPVTINGLSQPPNGGSSASCTAGTLLIAINGNGGIGFGLDLGGGSDGSFIRGLAVYGFTTNNVIGLPSGIRVQSESNTIQCNFVGTNAEGTAQAGGGNFYGLHILGGGSNLIGTNGDGFNDANEGNLFSGNSYGIRLLSTSSNTIAGNSIGTNISRSGAIGNSVAGVLVQASNSNVIGFDGTGGTAVEGNFISFNFDGIAIDENATGNRISANQITGNTALGIDLAIGTDPFGVLTPNDIGDGDTNGGNNLQNFPVISSANTNGTNTTVNFTLDSNPGNYTIEFFSNSVCSTSGNGEGATYLGSTTITLSSATFSAVLPPTTPGQIITSTAIKQSGTGGTAGDTSEFSACLAVPAAPPTAATVSISGRVTIANGRGIMNVRLSLTDSQGNVRTATTDSSGNYRFDDVQAGETYILTATGKRYSFSQPVQVLNINEETNQVNFIANSEKRVRSF